MRCNNDHGFTPDGSLILLSSHHEGEGSRIYCQPVAGGRVRRITPLAPSWWHGVSPDGGRIAYVAARDGSRVIDVHTAPLDGGPEVRLTMGEGHCDGPDYAPDGTRIYYNCDRDGHAQIWVMAADGAGQRKLFADDRVNWFPHPSPCGRHLVYLAYPPGTLGHPADLAGGAGAVRSAGRQPPPRGRIHRRQGTINVPSWAPDGSAFAFVRYEP